MRRFVLIASSLTTALALAACSSSSTPELRSAKDAGYKEVACFVNTPGSEYLLDSDLGVVRRYNTQLYFAHPTGAHGEGVAEQFSKQGVGTKATPCDSIQVDPLHRGGADLSVQGLN
ncbi:MAG TPA: hypothetical protein VM661_16435 [Candidatus Sulfotelmatobacter sp.]|jgi:hypothetical protein|nr:hypothetical protein [Candidatus Sulfotelmatobacter sp.]